jgi:putative ABC transport system permease protein
MKAEQVIQQAVRSMRRYKLRTSFMMLGSFIGVAALILVVSVGQAAQIGLTRMLKQTFGDAGVIVVGGGSRIMGGAHAPSARLTIDDMTAVVQEVSGIAVWDPQSELRPTVRHADATTTSRVLGGTERWARAWGRGVTRGQSFDASADAGAARVALIGETVAQRLFPGEDPVGAEIQIGAVPFHVIGVLEPFGVDMHGMDRDNEIVVPLTTLMRRLSNLDAITAAKIVVNDPAQQERIAGDIARVLRARHGLGRDQPDDFAVRTASGVQQTAAAFERIMLLYVPLVGGVILLVGGIIAATLMLASVNERVAEIGLRRAVGARPDDIWRQFLAETTATVVAGGVAGIVLALAGLQVLAMHFPRAAVISWTAIAIGMAASLVVGLLAGVLPARRAAQLRPADALR